MTLWSAQRARGRSPAAILSPLPSAWCLKTPLWRTQAASLCATTRTAHTRSRSRKKELAGGAYKGGNVSDLGGYFNELVYFCDKAAKGEKIEKATVCDAVASLKFLLKELAFGK